MQKDQKEYINVLDLKNIIDQIVEDLKQTGISPEEVPVSYIEDVNNQKYLTVLTEREIMIKKVKQLTDLNTELQTELTLVVGAIPTIDVD